MGTVFMSSFEVGLTRGCSNVDWRLISSISSWERLVFDYCYLEGDRDTLDRWDWSQRLHTTSEDWIFLP